MKDTKRGTYTAYQALDAPFGTVRFPHTDVDVVSVHLEGTQDLRITVHKGAEITFAKTIKGVFAPGPAKLRAVSTAKQTHGSGPDV